MKTRFAAFALCLFALILCVTPVILAEVRQNQPITIKTELTEGEVAEYVELSRGHLHFKTKDEVLNEFTQKHYKSSGQLLEEWNKLDETVCLSSPSPRTQAEMERVMNLDPYAWTLPEASDGPDHVEFQIPRVCTNEERTLWALADYIFRYYFWLPDEAAVYVTIAEANHVLGNIHRFPDGQPDLGHIADPNESGGLRQLSMSDLSTFQYGDMDSQIDGIPVSVLCGESTSSFEAAFVLGNARYYIEVYHVTQQEFIDLLISIAEVPRAETRNVIEYILEK